MAVSTLPLHVKIAVDVLAADLGTGEAALLNVHTGRYFALSPVAAWLWQAWTLNTSVHDSIDRLVQSYKVDRETAETDTAQLIAELVRRDLIAIVESE
jgi:hypothetical protein